MATQCARRGDPPLPTATVMLRGDLLDSGLLSESAQRNFDVYGFFGVSVFAETAKLPWVDVCASRFAGWPGWSGSPWATLRSRGSSCGTRAWHPTTTSSTADLGELVARILGTIHRVVPNPYHVPGQVS